MWLPDRRPAKAWRACCRAMVSVAFAYEGWIIAASISGELRRPRRDLPWRWRRGPWWSWGSIWAIMWAWRERFPTGGAAGGGPGGGSAGVSDPVRRRRRPVGAGAGGGVLPGRPQRPDHGQLPGSVRPGGPGGRAAARLLCPAEPGQGDAESFSGGQAWRWRRCGWSTTGPTPGRGCRAFWTLTVRSCRSSPFTVCMSPFFWA